MMNGVDEKGEERNLEEEEEEAVVVVESVEVETTNELLHLASFYGDIRLMSYALALDADRNCIVDKARVYANESFSPNEDGPMSKDYKLIGYTPLIKAVHSVIFLI
jgi:hypothetical protein